MRTNAVALALVIASRSDFSDAFTPATLTSRMVRYSYSNSNEMASPTSPGVTRINMGSMYTDDDDDDDFDDDDDDDYLDIPSTMSIKSPFTGLKLNPFDSKPHKPIYSENFAQEYIKKDETNDEDLVQVMSAAERVENLKVMRQIEKHDLPDLQNRRDHAGYAEASHDLRRRTKKDPWFGVNNRLRKAIQLGEDEEKINYLKKLAEKLGGPPDGVTVGPKGFAEHIVIFQYGSTARSEALRLEHEIRKERAAHGRVMMAELKRNQQKQKEQFEEDMRFPGLRQEREAKVRREKTYGRLMGELEDDRKKLQEKAKEMLGKLPDSSPAIDKLIEQARDELMTMNSKNSGGAEGDAPGSALAARRGDSAQKAREAAAAESNNGRPRLPGDQDVSFGELGELVVEPGSVTTTGPLTVEVSSSYNKEQSDPLMRKHCFQYTIKITNNSPTDTVQLLGRRFEIQTVGSSVKDVVQGEGVTGRQPIVKPGEVFEYTSTAPLSVRPVGTTIIAARMKGEYNYFVLPPGQETATEEQIKAGESKAAELGTFHFIFPEDQRVIPYYRDEDEDDEDEDEDDATAAPTATKKVTPSATASTKSPRKPISSTSTSVPGDDDIESGNISIPLNESSDTVTEKVRVQVSSSYRPERSDAALEKHCFAYNIRITNESENTVQLVSRRFEIQTIGKDKKEVVQGPGVTGRQPILKPGETFEYTSTAPLSVKPVKEKTPVVARMGGEYSLVVLGADGTTPISSTPVKAELGSFHFVLPSTEGTG